MENRPVRINDDRRTGKSLQEWAVILTLAANFAGLIWFAANIKSTQTEQAIQMSKMATVLDEVVTKQNQQDVTNAIIKMKLNIQN